MSSPNLSKKALNLLNYLVTNLKLGNVIPGDPSTYITYRKAHNELKLPMSGQTVGKSLEYQGLRELAEWIYTKGYPAITGIIINQETYYPSKGYFEVYKKTDMDFVWWKNEIFKSSNFNWNLALGNTDEEDNMVSELIFADEIDGNEIQLPEGAVRKVTVNNYERNKKAREICVRHYGYYCSVCGFDFEKVYGKLGRGYIHVHHLTPVSKIKKEYDIDPIKDLRPICPNCHAMIHKNDPPIQIEELICLINKKTIGNQTT